MHYIPTAVPLKYLMRNGNLAIILFTLLFSSLTALGQDDDAITVETNLVSFGVTVTGKDGRPVSDLGIENFRVLDNGKEKEIELFSTKAAPVTYGFVYDLHPTTSEKLGRVLGSIKTFTDELGDEEDFFTIVFNERGSLNLGFVPSVEQVERHLSLGEKNEPNSLYDAIFLAAEKMAEHPNAKKTLIIISDGSDRDSHHSYSELSRQLKSLNVQIYAVILDDEEDLRYSNITLGGQPRRIDEDNTLDKAALNELARISGGHSQETVDENLLNLVGIYTRIAIGMRNQYLLGFYPDEPDGKWHKLKVEARNPADGKKLSTSYRKGYQSPPAQ